jgi:hypothetical protein
MTRLHEGLTDAAQLAAWRRLWKWLLADEPEDSTAPRGEREAASDGTDLHEHSHRSTRLHRA